MLFIIYQIWSHFNQILTSFIYFSIYTIMYTIRTEPLIERNYSFSIFDLKIFKQRQYSVLHFYISIGKFVFIAYTR